MIEARRKQQRGHPYLLQKSKTFQRNEKLSNFIVLWQVPAFWIFPSFLASYERKMLTVKLHREKGKQVGTWVISAWLDWPFLFSSPPVTMQEIFPFLARTRCDSLSVLLPSCLLGSHSTWHPSLSHYFRLLPPRAFSPPSGKNML